MSSNSPHSSQDELTSVDDVRRIREKLSRQFDNDVRRLAEHAQKLADEQCERLGLKRVNPGAAVVRRFPA